MNNRYEEEMLVEIKKLRDKQENWEYAINKIENHIKKELQRIEWLHSHPFMRNQEHVWSQCNEQTKEIKSMIRRKQDDIEEEIYYIRREINKRNG